MIRCSDKKQGYRHKLFRFRPFSLLRLEKYCNRQTTRQCNPSRVGDLLSLLEYVTNLVHEPNLEMLGFYLHPHESVLPTSTLDSNCSLWSLLRFVTNGLTHSRLEYFSWSFLEIFSTNWKHLHIYIQVI